MTDKKFHFNNKIGDLLYGITADDPDELQNAHDDMMFFLVHNGYLNDKMEAVAPAQQTSNGEPITTEKFIEVSSIVFAGGKQWKVKGGWATQYGITCWPEVLEAAGILEYLDPLEENKPKGDWLAHYREVEKDGKMKADKVIRLEKLA